MQLFKDGGSIRLGRLYAGSTSLKRVMKLEIGDPSTHKYLKQVYK